MNDIHPIKPPIHLSIMDTAVPYVLAVVCAAALFGVSVLLYRRYQQRTYAQKLGQSIATNKEKKVLQALALLEDLRELLHGMRFHELYLSITALIKDTLAQVFDIRVKELTTSEIAQLDFPADIKDPVLHFLHTVDHFKFKDVVSEKADAEKLYQAAQDTLLQLQTIAQQLDKKNKEILEAHINHNDL